MPEDRPNASSIPELGSLWEWAFGLARKCWGLTMPAPDFRGQVQGAGPWAHNLSWLHIEVGVKRPLFRRDIPCCEVWMRLLTDGGTVIGNPIQMHWRSELPTGSPEVTLIHGRPRLIAVARRADGDSDTTVTDRIWMLRDIAKERVEITKFMGANGRKYKVRFLIRSGKKTWESGVYVLNVPGAGETNGHFRFEPSFDMQIGAT
mgnify:CR=1 FL=1